MPEPATHGAAAAAALRTTWEEMEAEVQSLPAKLILWVPAEGVWTVMDILCHIREFLPFWTRETRRIIESPGEQWGRDHTDTARLAAVMDSASQSPDIVMGDIRCAVEESASTLEQWNDADLAIEANSKNPRWGVKPASFVVDHLLVEHLRKHLGQIRRNVGQFAERTAGDSR